MYKLKNALTELEELGVQVSVKSYTPDENKSNKEIKAELAKPGGEFTPKEDGLIAQGRSQKNFALIVRMPKVSYLAAFTVQGKESKKIEMLSDFSEEDEKEAVYVKLVPTHEVWHGKSFSTKPHNNNLRIVSTEDGNFKKFEISIVTRIYQKETFFFLAVQNTYQARLYKDGEGRTTVLDTEFPGYKNWPELQELVEDMILASPDSLVSLDLLPIVIDDDADIQVEEIPLGENQGIVIFFNPRLGYGRAFTHHGVKHFSWEKVTDDVRFQHFEKDEWIDFEDVEENAKGGQLIGVKSRGGKSALRDAKSTEKEVM